MHNASLVRILMHRHFLTCQHQNPWMSVMVGRSRPKIWLHVFLSRSRGEKFSLLMVWASQVTETASFDETFGLLEKLVIVKKGQKRY